LTDLFCSCFTTILLTLDTCSYVLPFMQKQATAKLENLLYAMFALAR
jgi:hypothetical protein